MSNDATGRRAAREARRAAREAQADQGHEDRDLPGPLQAAREAATAAAVGAAVGAMKAFAEQQRTEQADAMDEPIEDDEPEEPAEQDEPEPRPAAQSQRRDGAREPREGIDSSDVERAVRSAREQVRLLKGADAESVSSFGRTRDGWRVTLEVLELQRIPETTDVLASYLVELDRAGNLVAFERLRRYQRSEATDS